MSRAVANARKAVDRSAARVTPFNSTPLFDAEAWLAVQVASRRGLAAPIKASNASKRRRRSVSQTGGYLSSTFIVGR